MDKIRMLRALDAPSSAKEPTLYADLEPLWLAYVCLHNRRVAEWSVHPIPVSEIHSYCEQLGISDARVRREILEAVTLLDDTYLRMTNQESERKKRRRN